MASDPSSSPAAPPPAPGPRARAGRAVRWLAPSAVAAAVAALAAGALEQVRAGAPDAPLALPGVVALGVAPATLVASLVARALAAAWEPGRLAAALREDGGAMPRLAGWIAVLGLGALGLAWAMFQATWLLSSATAFKPLAVGFALPVVAVATALVAIAAAAPTARLVAALARRLDARWRRGGRGTLLSPRRILAIAGALALVIGYVVWRLLVRARVGAVPWLAGAAPLAAVGGALAVHAGWGALGRARMVGGGVLVAAAVALGALGARAVRATPERGLDAWALGALAGAAADLVLDLDAVRARVPAATVAPAPVPGAPHPDILLVTLASARADRTPPLGAATPTPMPVLRDLAARGAWFRAAYAPTSEPWPALPALALGRGVDRVRERGGGLGPRHVTLAERLRGAGYDTAAFTCCAALWRRAGLGRGFAHHAVLDDDAALARAAVAWAASRPAAGGPPVFAWVHLGGPAAWRGDGPPPRDDAERARRYDAALAAADHALGQVVLGLAARARPPLVIVTALHGEALGDHGEVGHGTNLHDPQLRVPLVIAGPGVPAHGLAEPVSITALAATILDLAGFVPPLADPGSAAAAAERTAGLLRGLEGPSLAPLITRARRAAPDTGTALAWLRARPGATTGLAAAIRGRWKLVDVGGAYELYDLTADPAEQANLAGLRSDLVTSMRRLLDERRAHVRAE